VLECQKENEAGQFFWGLFCQSPKSSVQRLGVWGQSVWEPPAFESLEFFHKNNTSLGIGFFDVKFSVEAKKFMDDLVIVLMNQ